jgi:twitching motility two-component system response regulator PilH
MNGLDVPLLKKLFKNNRLQEGARKGQLLSPRTRILVVDDSKTFQYHTQRLLLQSGIQYLKAMDAEQGIVMARKEKPDLILMDVVLPGMNGFKATRVLHQDPETKGIPVIIISGSVEAAEQLWVLKIGAVDFLVKPFGRKELLLKLERHLLRSKVA